MMITDPETFPLLSHLLLTHILLRGGIPRTFLVRHESVQSIPTYCFSVRYGAREKPNDLLESQQPPEYRSGPLPGKRPSHLGVGALGPGCAPRLLGPEAGTR